MDIPKLREFYNKHLDELMARCFSEEMDEIQREILKSQIQEFKDILNDDAKLNEYIAYAQNRLQNVSKEEKEYLQEQNLNVLEYFEEKARFNDIPESEYLNVANSIQSVNDSLSFTY